jgi:hypothetical protein
VGDLAGETAVTAADLPVADDGGAQPFAEVEVGEVVEVGVVPGGAFGARRPVDVVVDVDRAVDRRRERLDRGELTDEERRIGQVDEPAGGAVDRVGGADDGDPGRATVDGVGGVPQAAGDLDRWGRAVDRLLGPGDDTAVDVEGLRDDPRRRDADDEGGADVAGQGVVGPDPAAAGGALAGVAEQAGAGEAADALGHGRLGDAGARCELGPGQAWFGHQRAEHVLVGEGPEQLERRLGGRHSAVYRI